MENRRTVAEKDQEEERWGGDGGGGTATVPPVLIEGWGGDCELTDGTGTGLENVSCRGIILCWNVLVMRLGFFIHSFIHSRIHSFIHSFINGMMNEFENNQAIFMTHSFFNSCRYSFIAFIHSSIHSLIANALFLFRIFFWLYIFLSIQSVSVRLKYPSSLRLDPPPLRAPCSGAQLTVTPSHQAP